MKTTLDLLSATEVSTILRARLGTARAWSSFLSDCIRDRARLHGLQLMPYACLHSDRSTVGRPLYRPADVDAFVDDVRSRGVEKPAARIEPTAVIVDDTPGVPWKMRRATRVIH